MGTDRLQCGDFGVQFGRTVRAFRVRAERRKNVGDSMLDEDVARRVRRKIFLREVLLASVPSPLVVELRKDRADFRQVISMSLLVVSKILVDQRAVLRQQTQQLFPVRTFGVALRESRTDKQDRLTTRVSNDFCNISGDLFLVLLVVQRHGTRS
ncbi:hypothetical protein D3C86_1794070 [compost metagenome]